MVDAFRKDDEVTLAAADPNPAVIKVTHIKVACRIEWTTYRKQIIQSAQRVARLSIKQARPGLFSLFLWEQGSIKIVKVLGPLNCSSILMCNFKSGGFCWFP